MHCVNWTAAGHPTVGTHDRADSLGHRAITHTRLVGTNPAGRDLVVGASGGRRSSPAAGSSARPRPRIHPRTEVVPAQTSCSSGYRPTTIDSNQSRAQPCTEQDFALSRRARLTFHIALGRRRGRRRLRRCRPDSRDRRRCPGVRRRRRALEGGRGILEARAASMAAGRWSRPGLRTGFARWGSGEGCRRSRIERHRDSATRPSFHTSAATRSSVMRSLPASAVNSRASDAGVWIATGSLP